MAKSNPSPELPLSPAIASHATAGAHALPVTPLQIIERHGDPALVREQVNMHTLEKAVKVQEIQLKQELTRRVEAAKKDLAKKQELAGDHARLSFELLEKAEIVRAGKHDKVVKLAEMLSLVICKKVKAAQLVKGVEFFYRTKEGLKRAYSLGAVLTAEKAEVHVTLFLDAMLPSKAAAEDEDDVTTDDSGARRVRFNGWSWAPFITQHDRMRLAKQESLDADVKNARTLVAELEKRLDGVAKNTEALTAQILRRQIEDSAGGKEVLAMMDTAAKAALDGEYVRLL